MKETEINMILLALKDEIEIWKMLQQSPSYPYLPDSGRCLVCGADTLWGDAPHKDDCQVVRQCSGCNKLFVSTDTGDGDFFGDCPDCREIQRLIDMHLDWIGLQADKVLDNAIFGEDIE